MGDKSLSHDRQQAVHVHGGYIGSSTVAVVDGAILIGQDDGHGQIIIEGIQTQIYVVDVRDANTDIVLGDSFEYFGRTDNLSVEKAIVYSGLTSKHDEQRLRPDLRKKAGFIQVIQPDEPV